MHDPAHFLPSFVWRAARDGTIRYANPWACRYLGIAMPELEGRHWDAFVHPDDIPPVLDALRQMRDGTLLRNVDVRLLRADGAYRWHTLHLQARRDDEGEFGDTVGVAIDIHESRHAWALYEASERRLQAAFAGARMGAWEWDMKTRVVRMTAQLAALYSFPPGTEAVMLSEVWDRVAPEYREPFQRMLTEALRDGGPFEFDFMLDGDQSEHRWLRMRGHPEFDRHGVLTRVYGVSFDISEQRADEERLSRSERRYRALVESTDALVWSADANGAIRPSGGDWEKFTGAPPDRLMGFGWLDFVHPDDRERTRSTWLDAVRQGNALTLTFRMFRRDGTYRIVQAHAAPLYDHQGALQEWFGTTTDVTPQYEAQAAIEARSLRLTVAMQAAKIHIVSLELETWTLLFETGGEWQVNDTITYDAALARVHPDDAATLDHYVRRVASGEDPGSQFEFRVQTMHGEQWMQGSALLQRSKDGVPLRIIGSVIDITERKHMELMLREAGRRKDEFLAMLAHELRNPLAPLRTAIALVQKDHDVEAQTREMIDLMRRQVEHMTRIVDDLLEVSRITQGRIALQVEPILVGTAVYHAVEAIAGMVEARSQHIAVDVPDATTWVCGDVTRLSQILVNVLNNASKYTPEQGRISVSVQADAQWVSIVIADSGTGISADLLPKVFELFSQGERTLDRSNGGLGIGLSLVKKLVEMHKGTITVQSPGPGLGTTVTVRLPRLHHHERHSARALSDTEAPKANASLRILVVDDNRDAADSLAMLCESEGHKARVAYSSAEALDAAPPFHPDVALLDIGLPDIDGYELARRLRRKGERAPMLIAITGYGQAEDRLRAQSAGFDYHFVKPVNVDSLLKLLSSLTVAR
ncbi:PAS domain-containing protein [Caballeronia sp. LP006]|jgi:PAS domain S-box-containing protein|uniref:PAS domain-containing hybrid sensor histidine kinase/response regulator n=1 Tax=unclassified Caballeronia TaxID=2646786 RepID=UPI0020279A46|nr:MULTISPECIES: PAS domain-containing protein [unclassified Caballeronia]MDR5774607.1 PAS domain-containing protein [Caballeronia sp. LZ002]MDR5799784.1 PAS domain-containing protein [Caballeronia sp. LZ001]MDR5828069.1 PAS domain-containing protein [Caballeronia sp. LP006]MDR5850043.1 PAS domain-containing protein [Caballeronia sp. LZ003]